MTEEQPERLHKVLAHAGVASRRKSEELIRQGRVTVNGQVVTELGTRVNPAVDDIRLDGQSIHPAAGHTYVVLHKPRGFLSSMQDDRGRPGLGRLVSVPERLYPVGRLDADSEGLILLTDDGELANLLTHPRYGHDKEYRLLVSGSPSVEKLESWRHGIVLDGQRTAPAQVDLLRQEQGGSLLRVVMREGRKRQLRRVAQLLGHPVQNLVRVRLGPLHLGTLEPGQWRYLTAKEIREMTALKRSHTAVPRETTRRRKQHQGLSQETEQDERAVRREPAPRRKRRRTPGEEIAGSSGKSTQRGGEPGRRGTVKRRGAPSGDHAPQRSEPDRRPARTPGRGSDRRAKQKLGK